MKKLFEVSALLLAFASSALAGQEVLSANDSSAAPTVRPDALTPFDGWDDDGAWRVGSRASFFFGGGDTYDRNGDDPALRAFSAGLNYDLSGGMSLHGSYFMQDIPEWNVPEVGADSPHAWKVGVGFSQEWLRFSSLMFEYGQVDAGFRLQSAKGSYGDGFASPLSSLRHSYNFSEDADLWFMGARQRWSSRFSTFERYARYDEGNSAGVRQWTVGMGWQYSPGMYMELAYDDQAGALDARGYNDKRVRLRTMISF